MARSRLEQQGHVPRRYKIIFRTERRLLAPLVALDEDYFKEAVDFANRMTEGDWWEIFDCKVKRIVASNRTHGKNNGKGKN